MDRLSDGDARPPASPVLAESEDERAIGENFCQPPLLPPSRATEEFPLLAAPLAPDLSFEDRSFDERSFDELSFKDLSFKDRSFEAPLLNDRPFAAPAAAARLEKKC